MAERDAQGYITYSPAELAAVPTEAEKDEKAEADQASAVVKLGALGAAVGATLGVVSGTGPQAGAVAGGVIGTTVAAQPKK